MTDEPEANDPADDLMPARMVNEHVYCPRLFWLEHVAGVFEHNEHTEEGAAAHRRVDKPGGRMAAPRGDAAEPSDPPPWHTRSLWLSSRDLGVTGKLDLVDVSEDGTVMPVDTKKGRGPADGGLWPADEVQLVLQGLLLREAGYACAQVACYYAAERRRVSVDLDETRVTAARAAVAEARTTLLLAAPPAPLLDSPRCPGCSLNAVCQPDELNALTRGELHDDEHPVRRVIPEASDSAPVTVVLPGARVGLRGESLLVEPPSRSAGEERARTVGLAQVAQLNVVGSVQVSTSAMRACMELGIPVHFLSSGGFFYGYATGHDSRAVHVRRAQFRAEGTEQALRIARVLIADKIANGRTLLRRNGPDDGGKDDAALLRLQALVDEALAAESAGTLLAREGEAAKRHWAAFSELLSVTDGFFRMNGRTRRPPRDATNAMVSFLAALLAKDCTVAVRSAGLDPYLGVFHTAHHGRPSMALDLMEPFRPLVVDSVVLGAVRRGEVTPDGFVNTGPSVAMKTETRRALVGVYERRMAEHVTHPLFGYRITYRQVLSVQARLLARTLTGEITEMPSFRTR